MTRTGAAKASIRTIAPNAYITRVVRLTKIH
jgi:hypothetical protein